MDTEIARRVHMLALHGLAKHSTARDQESGAPRTSSDAAAADDPLSLGALPAGPPARPSLTGRRTSRASRASTLSGSEHRTTADRRRSSLGSAAGDGNRPDNRRTPAFWVSGDGAQGARLCSGGEGVRMAPRAPPRQQRWRRFCCRGVGGEGRDGHILSSSAGGDDGPMPAPVAAGAAKKMEPPVWYAPPPPQPMLMRMGTAVFGPQGRQAQGCLGSKDFITVYSSLSVRMPSAE
jgi:hypothetical protein